MKDENLQAPWVGKTPEEYNHPNCKEYEISFTLSGKITILAKDYDDAVDQYQDMSYSELLDFIGDDTIEEIK